MEYVAVGAVRTQELVSSRLVLGCEPLGGVDWGRTDPHHAREAVARALDLGVTAFDTADVYGLGESERVLGRALGARARNVTVISKVGVNWRAREGRRARTFADLSPRRVTAALDGSLLRLGVECISLYFMHRPDPATPLADTLEVLERCRAAGKIGGIGASNFPASMVREANAAVQLTAVQAPYNLLDRRIEDELLPTCRMLGIPVLAYGTLAQGLLSGKYGAAARFDATDRRHRLPHFRPHARRESSATIARARTLGASLGRTTAQVCIRWVLEQDGVAGVIVGAKTPEQVGENVGACDWHLEDVHRELLAGERAPLSQAVGA